MNFLLRLHPLQRMLISLLLSVAALLLLLQSTFSGLLISVTVWCVFAATYLIVSWIVLFNTRISTIRERAQMEDGSRFYVILIVLVASFASIFTVLLLILSKISVNEQVISAVVSILAIMLSWTMVHTTLAFHYAHLYYGENPSDDKKPAGGLDFPGKDKPDYLDFAYFAFVVGMTFQVSDVQITDKSLRRLALLHGLIAFLLNTFVVALTINLIAGLR